MGANVAVMFAFVLVFRFIAYVCLMTTRKLEFQ